MTQGRIGYIYSQSSYAGMIAEIDTPKGYEYRFTYSQSYIDKGLPRIGLHLPVRPEPYENTFLLPFFANLMSEGWVKRHQAKIAKLDQEDKFGLLLGHGAELIGPVRILTDFHGDELPQGNQQISTPIRNLTGYKIDFPRSEFNEVAMESLGGVSISGVQPKMFLTYADGKRSLKTLTNAIGMGPFIVKPSPKDFSELAENEFMIMQLCKKVGFNVADHHLVPFSCGELAYVTGRFDLDKKLGRRPEFIEDLASAMNTAPGNKSSDSLSYEKAILTAHRLSGSHAQVLRDGFRQVLMAYIVGNNDMHLKNLSLIRNPDANIATGFTPVYDMLSVAPYREYDGAGELSLWLLESEADNGFSTSSYKQYGYYTEHDFAALAQAIGLGERAGQMLIKELTGKVKQVASDVINASAGSQFLKDTILNRIESRLATLERKRL